MGDFTSRHGGSWSRRFETLLVAQLDTGRNARRLDAALGGTRPADPAPGLAAAAADIVPDPDIDPAAGNLAAAPGEQVNICTGTGNCAGRQWHSHH
ncbi:hypothetical protein ITJ38_08790 [Agreia pratensis]|uniref:hypothetical protein n=1 Tax=Agreia pratensis TaxID=150121 RepID=UPI001889D692|nr:hypothetical protein [Agreia pratensis]MBF4634494.1 hypothetical protein [Agreia pratensis]